METHSSPPRAATATPPASMHLHLGDPTEESTVAATASEAALSKMERKRCMKKYTHRSWASEEQQAFLWSYWDQFLQAVERKKLSKFYEMVTENWKAAGYSYENTGIKKPPAKVPGEERRYELELKKHARQVGFSSCSRDTVHLRSGRPSVSGSRIGITRSLALGPV